MKFIKKEIIKDDIDYDESNETKTFVLIKRKRGRPKKLNSCILLFHSFLNLNFNKFLKINFF